ncbi:hypothetical protein DES43_105197 [Aquamicrobium defluvii]|uniref:Uncharacterized protein n=1 Tax=Aquamicrobium defluvii TaxID=69279 RepID=A0A4R6YIM4_9HYPH|nr:hypothetical protein DES43_105197 [Aquamicrobium defluvii]
MTGYEKSPDYGGPPVRKGSLIAFLLIVIAIAVFLAVRG